MKLIEIESSIFEATKIAVMRVDHLLKIFWMKWNAKLEFLSKVMMEFN